MTIRRHIYQTGLMAITCLMFSFQGGRYAIAEESEPIAFIGHGGFFDSEGKQIEITQDFIKTSQHYYSRRLLKSIPNNKIAEFTDSERQLTQKTNLSGQDTLLLQNRLIVSMADLSSDSEVGRIKAKLNALYNALRFQLPEHSQESALLSRVPRRKFVPDPSIRDLLTKQSSISEQLKTFSATTSAGQKYIDECRASGVPIPPPMGKLDPNGRNGWKSLGFIPKSLQFIVGTPAEVRVYQSDTPIGMCFALPRYTDDSLQEIELDGSICLGQLSSKVCIWDNQMPAVNPDGTTSVQGFLFGTGDQIPIGVPDLKVDPKGRYQAGGAEIEFGTGGTCTNCHAGENPYIIHPKVDLGGGVLMGRLNKPPLNLPTFGSNRYDPLVGSSWPQNNYSLADKLVPDACGSCHEKDGPGGRFPLLSTDLKEYCAMLSFAVKGGQRKDGSAIPATMPPSSPGSLKDDEKVMAFLKLCNGSPSAANGDPRP